MKAIVSKTFNFFSFKLHQTITFRLLIHFRQNINVSMLPLALNSDHVNDESQATDNRKKRQQGFPHCHHSRLLLFQYAKYHVHILQSYDH